MSTLYRSLDGVAIDAINDIPAHICVLDPDGIIVATNRAWDRYGKENSPKEYRPSLGANYLSVCGAAKGYGIESAAEFAAGLSSILKGYAGSAESRYSCDSPNNKRWFRALATQIDLPERRLIVSHTDITGQTRMELELAQLAATDPVTGVPHLGFFRSIANSELERIRRFDLKASVLAIELDHLDSVIGSYGHAVGEEAIAKVASVCKTALRKVDPFCQIGTGAFRVYAPGSGCGIRHSHCRESSQRSGDGGSWPGVGTALDDHKHRGHADLLRRPNHRRSVVPRRPRFIGRHVVGAELRRTGLSSCVALVEVQAFWPSLSTLGELSVGKAASVSSYTSAPVADRADTNR